MDNIDLSKYQIRTDLAIETLDKKTNKGIKTNEEVIDNIKISTIDVLESDFINKKIGRYLTIEFDDITDSNNKDKVKNIFSDQLRNFIKYMNINDKASCLIVGLGNDLSTPDSLGPLSIDKIIVTKHLFSLGEVSSGFRNVSAISPGVMGTTGIETSDLIIGIVNSTKPDFVIIIDALASSSLSRINKTIQITNTGIHPGSGVGNSRGEISKETLNIPVIAIGIPTVVDAVTIVSDTINFMEKQVSYHKKIINKPKHKLVLPHTVNYKSETNDLNETDKTNLMGIIGTLEESEVKQLIYEVLSPLGYNLMVTPKEIDFLIEKLSDIIALGLNNALHRQNNLS